MGSTGKRLRRSRALFHSRKVYARIAVPPPPPISRRNVSLQSPDISLRCRDHRLGSCRLGDRLRGCSADYTLRCPSPRFSGNLGARELKVLDERGTLQDQGKRNDEFDRLFVLASAERAPPGICGRSLVSISCVIPVAQSRRNASEKLGPFNPKEWLGDEGAILHRGNVVRRLPQSRWSRVHNAFACASQCSTARL